MEKDTENTTPTEKPLQNLDLSPDSLPRTRVILQPRRRRDDLPHNMEVPQDVAAASLPQFLRLPADMTEDSVNHVLRYIEEGLENELHGDTSHMDRMLVENAALFDLAARYYFSGGETGKINDRNFQSAMKASQISMKALMNFRNHALYNKRFEIQREKHDFEIREREVMQSDMIQKAMMLARREKYFEGMFDKKAIKKAQEIAERSRSHD